MAGIVPTLGLGASATPVRVSSAWYSQTWQSLESAPDAQSSWARSFSRSPCGQNTVRRAKAAIFSGCNSHPATSRSRQTDAPMRPRNYIAYDTDRCRGLPETNGPSFWGRMAIIPWASIPIVRSPDPQWAKAAFKSGRDHGWSMGRPLGPSLWAHGSDRRWGPLRADGAAGAILTRCWVRRWASYLVLPVGGRASFIVAAAWLHKNRQEPQGGRHRIGRP